MKGVQFKVVNKKHLMVILEPLLIESAIEAKPFILYIRSTEYADYFLLEEAIFTSLDRLNAALISSSMDPIEALIGEVRDAGLQVDISGDKMIAELTISAPYHGLVPSIKSLKSTLNKNSVLRGISTKRLRMLIEQATQGQPGEAFTHTIAKGLPPRAGKNSYIKTLVPNALERVLAPKLGDNDKADMRDFGELLCVEADQVIAKRVAPGLGRSGYTVNGEVLPAEPGNWKPVKLGNNVYISDTNKNQILAKVAGLPKYSRACISVDDVFVSRGVNVATGNIKYAGAVIINGDVTENMKIVANGDVTINGFVESAYIESGGDIIITQGASGKMQDIDCQLIAAGSIFMEHGQGLHIDAGKQLNVIKQLAYSNIKCKENIIIGNVSNPQGNLYGSVISCSKSIIAGSVGAVSGSSLSIDYSDSYNQLCDRFDAMNKLFKELTSNNADHEIKVSKINARVKVGEHETKMADINKELELERVFLNWLRISKEELQDQIDAYEVYARVIANTALYPGVTIKLNNTTWEAKQEYRHCRIGLEEGKWLYAAFV